MKKIIAVLVLSILLVSVCCVSAQDTVEAVAVVDGLEREIVIDEPVTSVITLAPSMTEIVCALGKCDLLKGTDAYSNYPEDRPETETVVNYDQSLNYELMLDIQPDLILAAETTGTDQVYEMEDLGLTVFYQLNPTDFDGLYENIREIAVLLDAEEEAEEVIADMQTRVAAVEAAVANVTERPTVFYEIDASDPTKPWTSGGGTFIDMLITMAGGTNIAADQEGSWLQLSEEYLIEANPDVIILGDSNYGTDLEAVRARAGWDAIEAVKTGAVYAFNDDLSSRPAPRLVEALEIIAGLLHPECFE